ncbi:MAG: YHYH protein [Crocinitomicaceae bacterium]|nr:YHYH protein [Crocinitomicaceae bacterium]
MNLRPQNILLIGSLVFLAISCSNSNIAQQANQGATNAENTFNINLDVATCKEEPKYESEFSQDIDSIRGARTIVSNSIPNHDTGAFPNSGNPNRIQPQNHSYSLVLKPKYTGKATPGQGYSFGILLNGVEVDPYSGEFFQGRNGMNREWNINALTSSVNLGTDCNNAHVQPDGKYHYHGTPTAYLEDLKVDGTKMVKIGYAADGFPIYYKYGYSDSGELIELTSGFKLKSGNRPGDGKSSPDGVYDGTYFQDYEYDSQLSLLDECNGRFGKTPESENEYYYVFTDNYPSSPLCFMGTPSDDFNHRMGGEPQLGGRSGGNRPQGGPNPDRLFEEFDTNKDDRLSKDEVRGPLQNDFDRCDKNNDGFLTRDELANLPPPPNGRRP